MQYIPTIRIIKRFAGPLEIEDEMRFRRLLIVEQMGGVKSVSPSAVPCLVRTIRNPDLIFTHRVVDKWSLDLYRGDILQRDCVFNHFYDPNIPLGFGRVDPDIVVNLLPGDSSH